MSAERRSLDAQRWPVGLGQPAASVKSSVRCRLGPPRAPPRTGLAQSVNRHAPKSHCTMRPTVASSRALSGGTGGGGRRRLVRRAPPPRSTLGNRRFTAAPVHRWRRPQLSGPGHWRLQPSCGPLGGQGSPGPRSTVMTRRCTQHGPLSASARRPPPSRRPRAFSFRLPASGCGSFSPDTVTVLFVRLFVCNLDFVSQAPPPRVAGHVTFTTPGKSLNSSLSPHPSRGEDSTLTASATESSET